MSQLLRPGYLGLLLFLLSMLLDASDHLIAGAAAAPPVFSFNFSADHPSTYRQDSYSRTTRSSRRKLGPPLDSPAPGTTRVFRRRWPDVQGGQLFQRASPSPSGPIEGNGTCRGDGMAFFLASFPSKVPYRSAGGNLGLITDKTTTSNIAPDDRFIAVEFDIGIGFDNDPKEKTDHIAIDINSVKDSAITTYLPKNVTLNGTMIADIVFNSSTGMLVAYLRFLDHPSSAAHAQVVSANLTEHLKGTPPPGPQVAVGFSAATAGCVEICQILSWSFNSSLPLIHQDTHNIARLLVELIIGGALVFALVLWFLLSCWEQKRIRNVFDKGTGGARRFEYRNLAAATDHFSEDRKLGQGAFGAVYSGHLKLLDHQVAVKKIVRESSEGHKDFFAEVRTISEAKHKNLVKFFGWCSRGHSWNILRFMCSCFWSKKNNELFLVYELMTNGNLNDYLYKSESSEVLSWQTR
ncbi:hypothetical protein OsJ_13674 [Oryza sativa Japonica Group]|uniref:Protein kinase domain-containing protein n=1 Tax=Oryza sativa subsp. japonica TaxID=39947 RepID=B9FDH9_ORYSJ|nr:hypothetical protein OsJ_13674 [Oryza sativa Japonica Group]